MALKATDINYYFVQFEFQNELSYNSFINCVINDYRRITKCKKTLNVQKNKRSRFYGVPIHHNKTITETFCFAIIWQLGLNF